LSYASLLSCIFIKKQLNFIVDVIMGKYTLIINCRKFVKRLIVGLFKHLFFFCHFSILQQ